MGSASTRQGKGFRSRIGEWTNAAVWFAAWMRQAWDTLPESGSMWICGNWRTMPVIMCAADSFGVSLSSVVVWDKDWIGVGPLSGLRQRYELVFQLGRPDFAIENRSEPDIWCVPWASARPSGHESEKPVQLLQRAVELSGGQTFLDPFMGSGTTGVACANLGRRFIGIEIEPRYFDIACERIRRAYEQPRLPGLEPDPHTQAALDLEAAP
jgi:site-specific DNA-methyltransferase (adenine-specific)